MNKIYVIEGPHRGTTVDLKEALTTVGRAHDNDICLPEMGISRHHAKLLKKDGKIFIVDLSSLQGVFINGQRIEPGVEVEGRKENRLALGNCLL